MEGIYYPTRVSMLRQYLAAHGEILRFLKPFEVIERYEEAIDTLLGEAAERNYGSSPLF